MKQQRLFAFRFLVVYFIAFNFVTVLEYFDEFCHIAPATTLLASHRAFVHQIVSAVGHQVFGITGDIPDVPWAPSDIAHGWLRMGCLLFASAACALVWTLFAPKTENQARLNEWFRLALRLTLVYWLTNYGFGKIINTQFPAPPPQILQMQVCQLPPVSLLWLFMGYSEPYCIFGGIAELVPALFLLSRRTTLLGALLSVAVLTNVVALNLCYDVPVKQFSIHLLLMALILAAPDAMTLTRVFLLNGESKRRHFDRLANRRSLHVVATVLPSLLLAHVTIVGIMRGAETYREMHRTIPLYGVWQSVEDSTGSHAGGGTRLIFNDANVLQVWNGEDHKVYACSLEDNDSSLTVGTTRAPPAMLNGKTKFDWARSSKLSLHVHDANSFNVDGDFDDCSFTGNYHRIDFASSPLMSRKFRWVLEEGPDKILTRGLRP